MILSPLILDTYDKCERRYAFSQKWKPKAISPFGLLFSALSAAITSPDPEQAAKDTTFSLAQTMELQSGEHDKFLMVRHIGYLAAVVGMAIRERLGPLSPVPATEEWQSSLLSTSASVNHRIILVSHLDDDRLRAEAHSWETIGELVALRSPLTLTSVTIGPSRGGRRHSPFTKGFLHPQNHQLRFARRQGKESGFSSGWEKVWREHRGEISTAKWLNGMREDNVLDSLIVSREIPFRARDNRMATAKMEMEEIRAKLKNASEDSPTRRSSCDDMRGACPFQNCCYSPIQTDPSQLPHLYRQR